MKYLKYLFVAGTILLATSSYTTKTSGLSEGVNPGNLIPDFKIGNELEDGFKMSDLKGQKVLVSLWAAYNADSHMKNVLLWNTLQKENYPLKMISISFDQSKSVFEKTLNVDGIGKENQYVDTAGESSDIYKKCQLAKVGFNNYLIDENGVIIATNLNSESLSKLLN